MEDEARYPALKKGDCAEARFRMYELRLSSIVRRSARLLRVEDVTTRILCRSCVGVVTLGRRDRVMGPCGQAVGTVEILLVRREYELELIA